MRTISRLTVWLLCMFIAMGGSAQKKNVVTPAAKKGVYKLPALDITFTVDTSGSYNLKSSEGSLKFEVKWVAEAEVSISSVLQTLEEVKQKYNAEEKIKNMYGSDFLTGFKDSASGKAGKISFYKHVYTSRSVPLYWKEKKNNVTLSPQQIKAFTKSNDESWLTGNTRVTYYLVHPRTKRVVAIEVFFSNLSTGGEAPTMVHEKIKEIIASVKFL